MILEALAVSIWTTGLVALFVAGIQGVVSIWLLSPVTLGVAVITLGLDWWWSRK